MRQNAETGKRPQLKAGKERPQLKVSLPIRKLASKVHTHTRKTHIQAKTPTKILKQKQTNLVLQPIPFLQVSLVLG